MLYSHEGILFTNKEGNRWADVGNALSERSQSQKALSWELRSCNVPTDSSEMGVQPGSGGDCHWGPNLAR